MSDDAPFARRNRRRLVSLALVVVLALIFLYVVLPRLSGADNPWERIKSGDPAWLAVAAGMELLSYGGYVLLFRAIFARQAPRIRWRESYLITFAGVAATRLRISGSLKALSRSGSAAASSASAASRKDCRMAGRPSRACSAA